jgi:hypothetical protein
MNKREIQRQHPIHVGAHWTMKHGSNRLIDDVLRKIFANLNMSVMHKTLSPFLEARMGNRKYEQAALPKRICALQKRGIEVRNIH